MSVTRTMTEHEPGEKTRRANVRLALVLAVVAIAFYLGFIVFGGQ